MYTLFANTLERPLSCNSLHISEGHSNTLTLTMYYQSDVLNTTEKLLLQVLLEMFTQSAAIM